MSKKASNKRQPIKKIVYACESGAYSDYSVNALFTKRQDAERYIKLHGGEVVPRQLDPNLNEYRKGLVVYRIIMRRDGSVRASTKMKELEPDAANHFRHTDPRYLRDEWCFFMWAKDRLSAIKIANERRAQLLALNRW